MDNPNPIYYSDLIKPDNSITNLIAQLDELIAKYNDAKKQIQTAAAETQKSIQQLSGATQEQRMEIQKASEQTDKLANEFRKETLAEAQARQEKAQLAAVNREANMIAKLEEQLARSREGSYNRLSAQYRLNKIRLNEMSSEERRATDEGRKLETETRKIYEEMSRLQEATGKYQLNVGHYQNAWKGLLGPLGQAGSAFGDVKNGLAALHGSELPLAEKAMIGFGVAALGVVAAIAALSKAVVSLMQKLGEFEQANVNLSTILGTDRQGMKNLTDAAKRLGATTSYTASQVTELQTELAKLGFSQGQIIGMEKAVLDFATAMGVGLSEAASVAGSTLRAFGYTSDDTEEVLSALAAACNNSALSFDRIQTSIGNVFPIAAQFGFSVKDTAALLGSLANAGLDASMAATATRNIILKMANPAGDLAVKLGRTVNNLDDLMDALIELRKGGMDLAEELDLVGNRAVSAFAAFVSGAESAKELRSRLEDVSGTIAEISEQRLQTLPGSIDILKSAWSGLLLEFEGTTSVARSVVISVTKMIDTIHETLFPARVFISEKANEFSDKVYTYYQHQGAEAAEGYIDELRARLEGKADKARGAAKKRAKRELEAFETAIGIASDRISTAESENAQKAAREAELAASGARKISDENKKAAEAAKKQRLADLKAVIEAIDLEISITDKGTDKMLELRIAKNEAQHQLELEQNRQKVKSERLDESMINAKFDKQRLDAIMAFNTEVSQLNVKRLQAEREAIQLEMAVAQEGSEEMLELKLANIDKQREIELENNRQKAEEIRQDEAAINAKYDAQILKESAEFHTKLAKQEIQQAQELAEAEFDLLDKNERQKTIFRLEQERQRLMGILELNETASDRMSETELQTIMALIAAIDKERGRLGYSNLYELLGLSISAEQQDAFNTAIDSIKDNIDSLIDSWNRAADAAVESANKQVEAAQSILDAEIEAREKGYANQVATAQRELAMARRNQENALKEQQKAQRAQSVIDSLQQTSSLITATANIWKAFSGAGVAGLIAAAAATATMWGAFAAAKIKARQVTAIEQYGEGTVELLQGGSHASGHDIDLGMRPNGMRRRAEGGEYFAIINKRNSRRYRNIIPDVINSFNDGTFAAKYQRANEVMNGLAVQILGGVDISRIEGDVSAIRKASEESRFIDGQGHTIIKYKNLTRKIRN